MATSVKPLTFPSVTGDATLPGSDQTVRKPWQATELTTRKAADGPFLNLDGPKPEETIRERMEAVVKKAQAQAREEAFAKGLSEGLAQGKAEGFKQGHAEALEAAAEREEALRTATEELLRARQDLMDDLEFDLAQMAMDIAESLAIGALEVEPQRIVALARQALSMVAEADIITLRAAPSVVPVLRDEAEKLGTVASTATIRIVEDPKLEGPACVVESELARVDLQVSQRLAAARELVASARGEG